MAGVATTMPAAVLYRREGGDPILRVRPGETHTVRGIETYDRVENGGEIRACPGDEIRI